MVNWNPVNVNLILLMELGGLRAAGGHGEHRAVRQDGPGVPRVVYSRYAMVSLYLALVSLYLALVSLALVSLALVS